MPASQLGRPEHQTDLFLVHSRSQLPTLADSDWESQFRGSFAHAPAHTPADLAERYPLIFERLHFVFFDNLLVLLSVMMQYLADQVDSPLSYTYHQLVSYLVNQPDSSALSAGPQLPSAFRLQAQNLHNDLLAVLPDEFHPYGHRLIAYFGIQAATKLETQRQWAAWYQTITAHLTPTSAVG